MPDVPPFELRPDDYVYLQVADHIEARIRAGELPVGARLPGEHDLAEEYGVAFGTARRVTRELRERGLIRTLPGKGSYVQGAQEDVPPADQ